jgi:sialic acid synthase SpsE
MIYIADIGANHDGDINRAFKLIELAKESGADVAKFQFFRAKTLINKKRFKSLKIGHQAKWKDGVYETYEKYQTPYEWIPELAKKCEKLNIEFMGTPYDLKAVDALDPYVKKYKIGSGDIDYYPFLEYIASKKKPVIIASGAACMQEVEKAYAIINDILCKHLNTRKRLVSVLKCNTNYTNVLENLFYLNLKSIQKYPIFNGISDHTKDIDVVTIATCYGMDIIERHFTDKLSNSPDNEFALSPNQWKEMVMHVCRIKSMLGDGIVKVEENEKESREIQRRSKKDWLRPRII